MYVEDQPDAAEIDRLFRFLTRPGPRFGLAVAIFADFVLAAGARETLDQKLRAHGRGPAATLDLHYDPEHPQDLVRHMIEAGAGSDALFVVGLERFVVDEFGQPRPTSSIANLNQRRDELPELLDTRVVFWVPKAAWPSLSEFAWDLCQVMMTTAELETTREVAIDVVHKEAPPEWLQLASAGEVPQLEQQLQTFVQMHETAASPRVAGDAAASVATLEVRLGHMASARAWLERASAAHEQAGQFDEAARLARRRAEMALFSGELDEARTHAMRACELARRGGHEGEAALAQALLAELTGRRGDVEQALEVLERDVLPTLRALGDEAAQASVLSKVADFREVRGDSEKALELREQQIVPLHARVQATRGPLPQAQANVARIADSYARSGKLEEAERITRSSPSPAGALAMIAQARGDVDTAATLRDRASMATEDDDPAAHARALASRAARLAGEGALEEALQVRREQELPIYEQLDDTRAQTIVLGEIADLLARLGRTDEASRVLEEQMLPQADRLGDARLQAQASRQALKLRRALGSVKQRIEASVSPSPSPSMASEDHDVVAGPADTMTSAVKEHGRRDAWLAIGIGLALLLVAVVAWVIVTGPFDERVGACEVLLLESDESRSLVRLDVGETHPLGQREVVCSPENRGVRIVVESDNENFHVLEWPPTTGLECASTSACWDLYIGCSGEFTCSEHGDVGCIRGNCRE